MNQTHTWRLYQCHSLPLKVSNFHSLHIYLSHRCNISTSNAHTVFKINRTCLMYTHIVLLSNVLCHFHTIGTVQHKRVTTTVAKQLLQNMLPHILHQLLISSYVTSLLTRVAQQQLWVFWHLLWLPSNDLNICFCVCVQCSMLQHSCGSLSNEGGHG